MVALARKDGVPASASQTFKFGIRARLDPQTLLRVAGLFAQRGLIPERIFCRTSGAYFLIDVEVALEDLAAAEILLQKVRSQVLVERADLVERAG